MPRTNEITNKSMNSSSALVAPRRSEIRVSFSIEYPSISDSTRKKLHRAAMILTPLLCVVLAVCHVLDLYLPWWAVALSVIAASVGFGYGFLYIVAVAEQFEREHQKGGRK